MGVAVVASKASATKHIDLLQTLLEALQKNVSFFLLHVCPFQLLLSCKRPQCHRSPTAHGYLPHRTNSPEATLEKLRGAGRSACGPKNKRSGLATHCCSSSSLSSEQTTPEEAAKLVFFSKEFALSNLTKPYRPLNLIGKTWYSNKPTKPLSPKNLNNLSLWALATSCVKGVPSPKVICSGRFAGGMSCTPCQTRPCQGFGCGILNVSSQSETSPFH